MKEIENWLTIDDYGVQMPWYTRPCLKWLEQIDFTNKSVFEYGVGYSTLWYKSMGAETYGVDHDEKWAELSGARYLNCDGDYGQLSYTMAILPYSIKVNKFDIICIDGIFRDYCTQIAFKNIKKGGYIIIDNYKQATADLSEWPITEKLIDNKLINNIDVRYYKEPTHEDWQTIVIHV